MKRFFRPVSFVLMLTSVIGLLTPAPASAALKSWTVRVIKVNDGDTFDVDADRNGTIDYKVRMIGLNTAEGHWDNGRWVGTCHSRMAHNRLEDLIEGRRVVLKATNFSSTGAQNRKLRFVHRLSDGKDITQVMLAEGRAVPFPNFVEPARNGRYIRAARAAQSKKIGIWNTRGCGYGPQQSAKLKVKVRWLMSRQQYAKEYVRIENDGTRDVSLKNWLLRDAANFDFYYFRDSAIVPAGGSATVHTGRGTNWGTATHKHYYWNQDRPMFAPERIGQTDGDRSGLLYAGDGAYLYDPHRDIRAYMSYPCVGTCTDPIGGKVDIHVNYQGGGPDATNAELNQETVVITNTSTADVDLSSYKLDTWPFNYEIARYPRTILAPGEQLTVHSGTDPGGMTSRLEQYWGSDRALHSNEDYIELRRLEGHVAKKHVWN